jgi:hypothetical protein
MEPLKQSQTIINLGKKLVEEFTFSGRSDITTRWMAHYLAELIERAETEKSAKNKRVLQQECCELILKLWDKRSHFKGKTKPLARLQDALSVLVALKNKDDNFPQWRSYMRMEDLPPWGAFMTHIRETSDDILCIILAASTLKEEMLKEKDWLKYKDLLSSEEYEIIKTLDALLENHEYSVLNIDGREPKKTYKNKQDEIFSKLIEVIESQKSELLSLQRKLKEGKTSK